VPNGNKLLFLGAHGAVSNNARLKSLESVNKLYVEEATEISRDDLLKIRLSLRTRRGMINEFYAYNPPDVNHHLMQYDYTLTSSKEQYFDAYGTEIQVYDYTPKIPNLTLVRTSYKNNLTNIAQSTADEMEALKHFDLTTYLSTIEGYVGGLQGGVVYRHFMPVKEVDFRSMEETSFFALDFGFSNDPCCLIECKYKNSALYCKLLVYNTMDDLTLAKRMLDCGVTYRDTVIADYGNGGDVRINTLRGAGAGAWRNIEGYEALAKGFSVIYAKKGAASILNGIQVVKSMKIYMTENSKEAWSEVRGYTWAVDRDGQSTGKPVAKNDHAMDCIRYAATYVSTHGAPV
jgi:PBSX family phage terminase large subunit